VGIFSLFGKKNNHQTEPSAEGVRDNNTASSLERFANSQISLRNAARATAEKIDAIETAMSLDLAVHTQTSQNSVESKKKKSLATPSDRSAKASDSKAGNNDDVFPNTLPMMGVTTEFLLGGESFANGAQICEADTAPAAEEAAILFANGQTALAEQMLLAAIKEDDLGHATQNAWSMLFDLYRITDNQLQFERLSIDYLNKFEISPPDWVNDSIEIPIALLKQQDQTPAVCLDGRLDGSIIKQLDRIKKLGEGYPVLRLEFSRISAVDPVGCGLLLRVLKDLQQSGHELILAGAFELAEHIRSILQVGRRDETETPWLLLLEILQLLRREQDFEETCIDYCVTFEVSPPSYEAPRARVVMIQTEPANHAALDPERFMMPAVIDGHTDDLVQAIQDHATAHLAVILDCSRLTRVDFNATGQLLNGLMPLIHAGKSIEFQDVNHLVSALFHVMGLNSIARIVPHRN
jgi:anti-anti-sigma regulatory factor